MIKGKNGKTQEDDKKLVPKSNCRTDRQQGGYKVDLASRIVTTWLVSSSTVTLEQIVRLTIHLCRRETLA